jgi:hypothetical protein
MAPVKPGPSSGSIRLGEVTRGSVVPFQLAGTSTILSC